MAAKTAESAPEERVAKYVIKGSEKPGFERLVLPGVGISITNEQLNDKVVAMLKKKLGDNFDKLFEKK